MTFHTKLGVQNRIRLDKKVGCIKIHDKIGYLVLFDYSY